MDIHSVIYCTDVSAATSARTYLLSDREWNLRHPFVSLWDHPRPTPFLGKLFSSALAIVFHPSMLWRCWLSNRNNNWLVKLFHFKPLARELRGKSAAPGFPGEWPLNLCVCVCVYVRVGDSLHTFFKV